MSEKRQGHPKNPKQRWTWRQVIPMHISQPTQMCLLGSMESLSGNETTGVGLSEPTPSRLWDSNFKGDHEE